MNTDELVVDVCEPRLGEEATAVLSPDRTYRYALTRVWDTGRPAVVFVMLNPSTADAFADDPTIRRCLGFARDWGGGSLVVVNLFGLRSRLPEGLEHVTDPVGPDNDAMIVEVLAGPRVGPVVVAWGNRGGYLGRNRVVLDLIARCGLPARCLEWTAAGHPRHPLYVPRLTEHRAIPPEDPCTVGVPPVTF